MPAALPFIAAAFASTVEVVVAGASMPYLPIIIVGAGVLGGFTNFMTNRNHKAKMANLEDTLKKTQELLQKILLKEENEKAGSADTTREQPKANRRSATQERSADSTREEPTANKRSATQERSVIQECSATREQSVDAILERSAVKSQIRELRDLVTLYEDFIEIYASQPTRLLEETKKFQRDLFAQLKRVSNAMRDGFMSADALHIWANGAAFHIQMLFLMERAGDESLKSLQVAVRKHRDTARTLCSEFITNNPLTSNERAQIHDLEKFFDDAFKRANHSLVPYQQSLS